MGVVPMLWMVAAVGVGYGWTPDGAGGVEYIIQISPEKFDQAKQSGEITSTIAPEVRGSVSRVVIRIGDGPLERITPPEVRQREQDQLSSREVARDDLVAVPIPEMDDSGRAIPIGGQPLAAQPIGRNAVESVMKPDPQQPGGGFAFPSDLGPPPNAVQSSGQEVTGALDQLRQRAAGWSNELADQAADATRNAIRSALPQDENSIRGERSVTATPPYDAEPRMPSSPGSPGDDSRFFNRGTVAAPVGTRDNGPSTAPTPSGTASPWYAENQPAAGQQTTGGAPRPANANPQPWSPPANSAAAENPRTDPRMQDRGMQDRGTGVPGDRRFGVTDSFGRMPAGFSSPHSTQISTAEQAARGADTRFSSQGSGPAGDHGSHDFYAEQRAGQGASNQDVVGERRTWLQTPTASHPSPSDDRRQPPSDRLAPNDRFADSRMAVEGSRRPIEDRQQGVSERGLVTGGTERQDTIERSTPPATATGISTRGDFIRGEQAEAAIDPAFSSRDSSRERRAKTVAAQPVFNGLLLFSFVANIYLAWWLKNLRHEFRELVAAKRNPRSGGVSA